MATIYLVKGYLDVAATTLADAQALLAALADPSTATNSATIGRVTDKLETMVQSDSGEPLTISSIDDTAGSISSWVTDADTTLAFAIGDADPTGSRLYAFTSDFTISGSTRTATLILNTAPLAAALSGSFGQPSRGISSQFTAQIRKTNAAGFTETVGRLPQTVVPGVITTTPSALEASTISAYVAAAAASAASASSSASTATTQASSATSSASSASTSASTATTQASAAAASAAEAAALVDPDLATLTDQATTAWDLANPAAKWTLGGNRTLTVSNLSAGASYILHVIQSTGSNTVTWPASVKWPSDVVPVLSTAAAARDIFSFTSDGTYLFGNFTRGYSV
jgi:hypothetical protein